MKHFNTTNVIIYLIYTFFAHNLQLHAKNFRGTNQIAVSTITIGAVLSMVTEYAYDIYYGYKVVWWAAIVLFLVSLVMMFITGPLQKRIGAPIIGVLGLIILPICAYFMFHTIPVK